MRLTADPTCITATAGLRRICVSLSDSAIITAICDPSITVLNLGSSNPNSLMNRSKSIHDKQIDLAPKLGSPAIRPPAKKAHAPFTKSNVMGYQLVDTLAEDMALQRVKAMETMALMREIEAEDCGHDYFRLMWATLSGSETSIAAACTCTGLGKGVVGNRKVARKFRVST